jgi:hypothetical protein
VSEQQADQTKAGSAATEPGVMPQAPARSEMDAAVPAITVLESPRISPDHEAPIADVPGIGPVKAADTVAKPSLLTVETPKLAAAGDMMPKDVMAKDMMPAEMAPRISADVTPKIDSVGGGAPKLDVPGRLLMASPANDTARAEAAAAAFQRAVASPSPVTTAAKPDSFARASASGAAASGAKSESRSGSNSASEQPAPPRAAFALAGRRGLPAAAAMLALALLAGGMGGALATVAFLHGSRGQTAAATSAADPDLAASVAQIKEDVANLKASLEQTNQTSLVELNKAGERLDKVEKTQAELAKTGKPGEVAKLSEAVERLRAAQASAATQGGGHEATGSVASQATSPRAGSSQVTAAAASGAGVPAAASRAAALRAEEASQPKVLEGWVLRDVGRGGALIEGRQGLFEVYAGDPVPGLGKVDSIRRQDGRWVVVTTKGLVVSR